jgi:nucleoside-triphosphatase
MKSVFLLTGKPGTGKTTVIRKALSYFRARAGGFYTEEIRESYIRKGFKIITLDGRESVLSHVDFKSKYSVGKYHVSLENLENVAVPAILNAINESDIIVIDEIGKMELLSPSFRDAVLRAVNSGKKVLGTIMLNPHPFADNIKNNPNVNVIMLSIANREDVLKKLTPELAGS